MTNPAFHSQPLVSNGYNLAMAPTRLGGLEPTDPRIPVAELREIYSSQGYLWLKNILDRQEVLSFRRHFFTRLSESGILSPDDDPGKGIDSGSGDHAQVNKLVMEIVRSAAYEAFCLSRPIWQFYETFLDGDPYLHKRKILRHTRPGDPARTGVPVLRSL